MYGWMDVTFYILSCTHRYGPNDYVADLAASLAEFLYIKNIPSREMQHEMQCQCESAATVRNTMCVMLSQTSGRGSQLNQCCLTRSQAERRDSERRACGFNRGPFLYITELCVCDVNLLRIFFFLVRSHLFLYFVMLQIH